MTAALMSKKELYRLKVLVRVQSGRLRVADACELLSLKRRQVCRLLAGSKHSGAASLIAKPRGRRPSNNRSAAKPFSGRYLSFAEREEIALLRAQGTTQQEIARQLGRAQSTISRELCRNAVTRSGGLDLPEASTLTTH